MEAPLKILPQNIEAEQSVLGSMILDKNSIADAAEVLRGEDFYRENHKIIYSVNNGTLSKRYSCGYDNSN